MIFCMQHFDLFGIKQPVSGNTAMLFLVWKEAFCNGVGLMIELCGATSQGNVLPAGPRVCRPSVALLLMLILIKLSINGKSLPLVSFSYQ